MRIVMVVHGYPPDALGGTEVHTATLAHELTARGHEVRVLAGSSRGIPGSRSLSDHRDGGVAVRQLGGPPEAGPVVYPWSPWVRRQFEGLLDEARPDVVHIQHLLHLSTDLIEAARARGVPTVVTLHDFWFQCPAIHPGPRHRHPRFGRARGIACTWHWLRRPRRLASLVIHGNLFRAVVSTVRRSPTLRRQLEMADVILAPSRFVRDSFVRFGIPPEKLRVMPHGTHVKLHAQPPPSIQPVRFGFVGSVIREKGVHVLCKAFGRLDGEATLDIHGRAPDSLYLRRISRLFGPRIRYRGDFLPEEAASVYAELDVLVIPSLVGEAFGLTAAEGLACGLPGIASRIGALPERLSDGHDGILVPPGDVDALRRALQVLQDPAEVRRLASGVRPPRSMAAYTDEVEELYAALASGRSGPPPYDLAAAPREVYPGG